jgi:hypothetical protein
MEARQKTEESISMLRRTGKINKQKKNPAMD